MLVLLVVGFVAGIIWWGAFNTGLEATNSLEFCISCHEMRDNVYKEYKETIHYSNRTGVRAICSDCHVPKDWTHKLIRKIQASEEVWGKITGYVDTPEKFEAHRMELATHEWARMKAADSRECRNCHSFDAMSRKHPEAVCVQEAHGSPAGGPDLHRLPQGHRTSPAQGISGSERRRVDKPGRQRLVMNAAERKILRPFRRWHPHLRSPAAEDPSFPCSSATASAAAPIEDQEMLAIEVRARLAHARAIDDP